MRALMLAAVAALGMAGAAGANTVTYTFTGVFDLVGAVDGAPSDLSLYPSQITRSYSIVLNDEAGELRSWKYDIEGFGSSEYAVRGDGYSGVMRPDVLKVTAGRRTNGIIEYAVQFSRYYDLIKFNISSPMFSDYWDIILPGTSTAYQEVECLGYCVGRYEGTVTWTVEVAPIPLPAAAPLLLAAIGGLAALGRSRGRRKHR